MQMQCAGGGLAPGCRGPQADRAGKFVRPIQQPRQWHSRAWLETVLGAERTAWQSVQEHCAERAGNKGGALLASLSSEWATGSKCAMSERWGHGCVHGKEDGCAVSARVNLTTAVCFDAFGYQAHCHQVCRLRNVYSSGGSLVARRGWPRHEPSPDATATCERARTACGAAP